MGDCRIRIQVSENIVSESTVHYATVDSLVTITAKVWSADTTIEDLFRSTQLFAATQTSTIRSLINTGTVSVWDCTTFPSRNVSQLCQNVTECKTITLYAAGWFPSGSIQILNLDATEPVTVSSASYDDYQYNRTAVTNSSNESSDNSHSVKKVQLVPSGKSNESSVNRNALPSQVLRSVAERFQQDDKEDNSNDALRIRLENKKKKQQAILLRHRRLDAYIQRLKTCAYGNQNISEQVHKMLIKSRATGRTNIQIQDRVYLHCILWYDTDTMTNDDGDNNNNNNNNPNESYKYFSIQDSIGHALDTFSITSQQQQNQYQAKEMLIQIQRHNIDEDILNDDVVETNGYRRFPSILRFYEAIQHKFISINVINTVIIRYYNTNHQEATTSIFHQNNIDQHDTTTSLPVTNIEHHPGTSSVHKSDESIVPVVHSDIVAPDNIVTESANETTITINDGSIIPIPIVTGTRYNQLWDVIKAILPVADDSTKRKSSLSKEKVRQMQMKSKGIGDVKRIKQIEDRFFLQLIITKMIHQNDSNTVVQIRDNIPIFVSRFDTVDRMIREYKPLASLIPNKDDNWELLIPLVQSKNKSSTSDCDVDIHNSSYKFRQIAIPNVMLNNTEAVNTSMKLTWENVERKGIVNCFDYIVLNYRY
jgi:hypothetical protein